MLHPGPRPSDTPDMDSANHPLTPALSGTLARFPLVHLLRLLQMVRATGRLEIVRGEECTHLFVIDGRSAFASTNGVHPRVGDVLAERGDIRPEAADLAAAVQEDVSGPRIGRMLVENGVITPEQMREAVLEVQRGIIRRALLWESGAFRFHPGERPGEVDITLDLDLDRLLLDALRDAAPGAEGRDAA